MLPMLICFGVRLRRLISRKPRDSQLQSTNIFRASYLLITARLLSIGSISSTPRPSATSRWRSAPWAISFNSSIYAGFHSLNLGMFDLARDFRETGMTAYVRLQQSEFDLAESYGYEAVSHQRFVGSWLLR